MSELLCLELSALLWALHILAQSFAARSEFGDDFLVSARDNSVPAKGNLHGRATRALANFVENYGPFIALDVALLVSGQAGGWGATVWIVSRAIYLPLYLLGVKYLRTVAWSASLVGLVMMGWRLAGL